MLHTRDVFIQLSLFLKKLSPLEFCTFLIVTWILDTNQHSNPTDYIVRTFDFLVYKVANIFSRGNVSFNEIIMSPSCNGKAKSRLWMGGLCDGYKCQTVEEKCSGCQLAIECRSLAVTSWFLRKISFDIEWTWLAWWLTFFPPVDRKGCSIFTLPSDPEIPKYFSSSFVSYKDNTITYVALFSIPRLWKSLGLAALKSSK